MFVLGVLDSLGVLDTLACLLQVLGLSATLPNVEDIARWNHGSNKGFAWQCIACCHGVFDVFFDVCLMLL